MLGTLLGMMVVDAYMLYKFEMRFSLEDMISFTNFVDNLSYSLILNIFDDSRSSSSRKRRREEGADVDDADVQLKEHVLKPLCSLPCYKDMLDHDKYPQRICKICKRKASFYCRRCSANTESSKPVLFAVCGASSGRECHAQHIIDTKYMDDE